MIIYGDIEMRNMSILKGALFIGFVFGAIRSSYATDLDCAKLTQPLCVILKQATSDLDTFSVSINFFPPVKDTSAYCRNIDPKQNPNAADSCELSVYDSAYYAKLKSDAHFMFTNFELWDAKHPTVRLTPPSSGTIAYKGITATKSIIIEVLEEDYVSTIEDWEDNGPNLIMSRAIPRTEKSGGRIGVFLPDGRAVAAPASVKAPYFFK